MLKLSPELREESSEQSFQRQRVTGVFGNGQTVECHPTGEQGVKEMKHRAVCLLKPYSACQNCCHSKFKLFFNANPNSNLKVVKCPRWTGTPKGPPDSYVSTEVLTCADKPFEFCGSCPSLENLSSMYIDKTKDGWYSRFVRFSKESHADSR